MESLNTIIESTRQQLINLENLQSEINGIGSSNIAVDNLKERLDEMLSTAIADLFVTYDLLVDVEGCIDENDLLFLLDVYDESEVIN